MEVLEPQTDALNNRKGTTLYMNIIVQFWNIVNVKYTTEGLHKPLYNAKVIYNVNDVNIHLLNKFSCWLKLWHNGITKRKEGHLLNETFVVLAYTVDTLILLIKDLL